MSFIESEIISSTPTISEESVRLAIVKDNTKAYDTNGREFILTPEALAQDYNTWEGGIVTVNHKYSEQGILKDLEYTDGFVYATLKGLSSEVVELINSKAFRGTSQESVPIKLDQNKVIRLKGSGTTLVFYPEVPACNQKMGCGIPVASLNFPLNSQTQEQSIDSSGGTKVPDNDDKIIQLESTIKQKDGLISTKNQEIADLKSTNTKLEEDLKAKDGQIASTVQAAVKAALESHDAEYMAKQEHDAAVKELSSFMKEDTLKEFLNAKPSVEVIKSTASALKSSISKQVGAEGGEIPESLLSIHDEWNAATGGEQ